MFSTVKDTVNAEWCSQNAVEAPMTCGLRILLPGLPIALRPGPVHHRLG